MLMNDEQLDALRYLLSIPQGREFVMWVLQQTAVYSSTYDPNTGTVSAFAEGNRNVGLKVLRALQAVDPAAYPRLLLERQPAPDDHQEHGTDDDPLG